MIKISEQNLIDCNKNEDNGNWGCNGGNMQIAFDYIRRTNGINNFAIYPYQGRGEYDCKYDSNRSVAGLDGFEEIETNNETILMYALAEIGPISVAIDASLPSFIHYSYGVYDDPECTNYPNHAGEIFKIFENY